ncbi:MAG: SRPBCC domain-containing protein [Bacteroidota bacterium]
MVDERWTKFKVTADYNAPVRTIYEAWTTQAGLESWFLRDAFFYTVAGRQRARDEFVQTEDSYLWHWHGYPDDVFEKGAVLETNGSDFLKFTFSDGTIVSVNIESKYGLTIAELVQENIPIEANPSENLFVGCQTGWLFYMANLKSILEGGVDLRSKRVDVPSSFK